MPQACSAGILMLRRVPHADSPVEVLLAHPGGPYWSGRDAGAWTLPKGECLPGEELLTAALREFTEETGFLPTPPFAPLGEVKLKSGKRVLAWACVGDADPALLRSNSFEMEWPPRSGRRAEFPEIDRAAWFTLDEARRRILPAQLPFLERVVELPLAMGEARG